MKKATKSMTRAALASVFVAFFVFGATSPGVAVAQDKDEKGDDKPADGKVKNYDFTGDEIDGDLIKPDGDFIDTRSFADHGNLIRIRQDFIKEILKSAEDL